MARRKKRAPALAITGLVVAGLAVAFVLGEVAVRLIYGAKYRPRPVFGVGDTRLGWKPSPNLDDTFYGPDYSVHIRTDADGYRLGSLGEIDYSKELVVLLGDSYGFGWGLSTDDTFASRLDALLYNDSGKRVRLVNLSVGGYGILQSADRFAAFLSEHPDARVRAVLQQHCVNDAVDNFRSLGYHLGRWNVEQVQRPASRSHLLNMIAYARMLSRKGTASTAQGQARDAAGADMLWSFQRRGAVVELPAVCTVGGQEVRIDKSVIRANLEVESAPVESSLEPAQRDIMTGALNILHETCAARRIRVVHTFIATTPGWYVTDVSALAKASAEAKGCAALITGAVPAEGGSEDSIKNPSSAGHFNAAFSRFWAQRMAHILFSERVVAE